MNDIFFLLFSGVASAFFVTYIISYDVYDKKDNMVILSSYGNLCTIVLAEIF